MNTPALEEEIKMENDVTQELGLERETIPFTTHTLEGDGDRYWHRPFEVKESYEHAQLFEGLSTEAKVKTGLELWRAKLYLGHGAWYPYLYRAHIDPSKSERRRKVAKRFMEWAKIIRPMDKIQETNIVEAMDLIYSKSCILQDFTSEVSREVDINQFVEKGYRPPDYPVELLGGVSLGNLKPVLKRIDRWIERNYIGLTVSQQQEAKDTLNIIAGQFLSRERYLHGLDEDERE